MGKKAKNKKGSKKAKNKKEKGKKVAVKKHVAKSIPKEDPPDQVVCQNFANPGILPRPLPIVVLGITEADYQSIKNRLQKEFCKVTRILLMMPWGTYAIFREWNGEQITYYLYNGCSCIKGFFRYFDLKVGTAGLIYFQSLHEVVVYILENRFQRETYKLLPKSEDFDHLCYNFSIHGGEDLYKVCDRRGEIFNIDDYAIKEVMFSKRKRICKL